MKVSIITPCLNSEKTIRDTIESVLKQTYKNIEYIIVDGGSTDSTIEIIKSYQTLFHGRMKVVSEKDKGIYDAMNKGIRMSTGSLIGIINSDDYYEPDAVRTVVNHMTSDKYQVIYGHCRLIRNQYLWGYFTTSHEDLGSGMIPHSTCFVTRKVYCDLGLFLTCFKIASDYELMVRLYQTRKVTFTQIRQILADFRMGGISGDEKKAARECAVIKYYHGMISLSRMIGELVRSI